MAKGMRVAKITKTFTFAATGTAVADQLIGKEGILFNILIVVPAFVNNVIPIVTVEDDSGTVFWIATNDGEINLPLDGSEYLCCNLTGAAGLGGGDVGVVLHIGDLEG